MGLLDWFERKAKARLRKSQIKILFQNQAAVDYLLDRLGMMKGSGMEPDRETLEALHMFQEFTDGCVVQLTWDTCLPDDQTPQLLLVNNGLKSVYGGMLEGSRAFRASMGFPSGDLVPFANRFSPAAGWEQLSDSEWDNMVSKALSRLPKS